MPLDKENSLPISHAVLLGADQPNRETKLVAATQFAQDGDDAFLVLINGILGIYADECVDYENLPKDIIDICDIGFRKCIEKKLKEASELLKVDDKPHKYMVACSQVRSWQEEAKKYGIHIEGVEEAIQRIEKAHYDCIRAEQEDVIDTVRNFFKE